MRTKLYGKTYRNDELLLNKSCFLPNSFNGNQEARLHFHTTPSTTQSHNFKPKNNLHPLPTSNLNLKNHFPTLQKPNFKMKFHFQTLWKPNFKLKYHFHTGRRSFLKKISYFRPGRKSERELTNYLLTPKMWRLWEVIWKSTPSDWGNSTMPSTLTLWIAR